VHQRPEGVAADFEIAVLVERGAGGEISTTGSRLGEALASRVAAAALSSVMSISCGTSLPSVLAKSSA
jgi:hypothetical protein